MSVVHPTTAPAVSSRKDFKEHPRYTEIKVALIVHVPFFSSLLFDLMEVEVGKFPHIFGSIKPTAATNGKTIFIDEDFLTTLDLPQAVFLMCHEIGHAMWLHMARAKHYQEMGFDGQPFNPKRWNFAGDYIINDMLIEAQVGEMPRGGLHDRRYTNMMQAEDVYRLLDDVGEDGGGGKDGNGNDGGTMDVHIPAHAVISEAEMKRAVQTAANAAQAQGKLPGSLERFAENFLKVQVRWQDRLRYHITRAIARDATTWARPHRRRLVTQGIYLPAYTGHGAGDVIDAVDTSGSISQHQYDVSAAETDEILATCNPTSVTLLGADADVNTVHYLQAGDSLRAQKLPLGGGGGTDFRPVFEWIRDKGLRPACLIYFTDMEGTFPAHEPEYPVIWCRMNQRNKIDPPFGEVIDVDIKDEE